MSLTLVNDTYAETQAFLQFLIVLSMTNMQATWFKSHSVFNAYLSLTKVNDKYAGYRVKITLSGHAYLSLTTVNDKNAETQAFLQFLIGWSMTNMQATEFKSHSVFNAYLSLTLVNGIYAETQAFLQFLIGWSMTNMQAVD